MSTLFEVVLGSAVCAAFIMGFIAFITIIVG